MRRITPSRWRDQPRSRHGLLMTELIVAAVLLISTISLLTVFSARTGKLWQDSRHYRLAVEELTNQLEKITSLDEAEIDARLADLRPSAEIEAALPNPRLSGKKVSDDYGRRVVVEIRWDRPGNAKPLSLVAWIAPPEEGATP